MGYGDCSQCQTVKLKRLEYDYILRTLVEPYALLVEKLLHFRRWASSKDVPLFVPGTLPALPLCLA